LTDARAPLDYRGLSTARLRLRRPRAEDATLVFTGFGADPEVMRFLSWRPHASLEAAEAAVQRRLERLENGVEYSWVLEDGAGAAVGMISGWLEGDALELGFALVRPCWGRGLMSEAAAAVKDWALGTGSVRRVWATCDAENHACARVLEKVGLEPRGAWQGGVVRPNLEAEPRPSLHFSRER
jgi:RimJ/RimL family protein N-acetyltransferase